MVTGGMLQLVAYGSQDLYLTSRPQITFWKSVHKRHTLFAHEPIKQEISGNAFFGKKFTVSVAKNGDLLHRMMVEINLPDMSLLYKQMASTISTVYNSQNLDIVYQNDIALLLLKSIELDIGGQRIERHVPEWLDLWLSLSTPDGKRRGLNDMIGHYDNWDARLPTSSFRGGARTLFVPLQFFFNRHAGLALPLVAMTFHDVKIHFELQALRDCVHVVIAADGTILPEVHKNIIMQQIEDKADLQTRFSADFSFDVFADMIFLDTMERKYFSSNPHEYLIEQVQFLGDESIIPSQTGTVTKKVQIPFVNPVKELLWVFTDSRFPQALQYIPALFSLRLLMNGNDRFSKRVGQYFSQVQPWQHHTAAPRKPIYSFSFALSPEDFQPSGTCNFSKLDSVAMLVEVAPASSIPVDVASYSIYSPDVLGSNSSDPTNVSYNLRVFAHSYNILRISEGLAGMAYHN
jgi:hypothetical protein